MESSDKSEWEIPSDKSSDKKARVEIKCVRARLREESTGRARFFLVMCERGICMVDCCVCF